MNDVVAHIYIALSVTLIILFILTRKISFRIIKNDDIAISIGFTILKIELTNITKNSLDTKSVPNSGDSEFSPELREIFSLITLIFRFFKKCTVKINQITIPIQNEQKNMYVHFAFKAITSALIAYIDSNVEKLILPDNTFTLSSDGQLEFDFDLKIMLFDLIILIIRLIIEGIKIERSEKANVGK